MCAAQTTTPAPAYSKFEFSVGYDRLWNNVSIADLAPSNLKTTFLSGLNGADIGATFNFKPTVGLKLDFSANTQSGNFTTSGKNYSFAVGPVIKKHSGKFNPFGEMLVGVAHQSVSGFSVSGGQNAFTAIAGGGIDVKLSQHISVRPVEADYVWTAYHTVKPTDFLIISSRQNNFRYVGGLVFTF
jgi:hypothetical protein